ncbi:MAG: DNA replication/repair protein RecF [Myxococcota bacterium]|nr:DNA replication/repair protein RecF [Myxococcota bacterium]
MDIKTLNVRNFRNLRHIDFEPHPRFNIISGQNGQGKTNLIESIYWLATLRPFRTNRIKELISWSENESSVESKIRHLGLDHRLSVQIKNGQRLAHREGKKARANQYFGALSVVLFTPDDVGLVRGAPDGRRRFLDRAIFTGKPTHFDDCIAYRRALDARNKLLRDNASDDLLDAYELTLARTGAQIIRSRTAFIESVNSLFVENVEAILGDGANTAIRYKRSVSVSDSLEDELSQIWLKDRERDRDRGFTQKGPHSEDFVISLSGHTARNYASQGQQRALVLALKIAEIQLLKMSQDQVPVVLLDDVSSELDAYRNERLFHFLNRFEGQVFITTTDPAYLRIDGDKRQFAIKCGSLSIQET